MKRTIHIRRGTRMNYYKTIGVLLMLVMICPLYSQETAVSSEASSSPSKIKLSLPEVVRNVVERNLEVQKASIEYNDADTDLSKFDGQYDTYIYGRAGKQYKQLSEENPSLSKNGYRTDVNNYEAGIQKRLITGTTISANVSLTDQTVTPMPGVASFSGYSSSVNIGLSQELLKNAFGLDERLAKKTLENVTEIKKTRGTPNGSRCGNGFVCGVLELYYRRRKPENGADCV